MAAESETSPDLSQNVAEFMKAHPEPSVVEAAVFVVQRYRDGGPHGLVALRSEIDDWCEMTGSSWGRIGILIDAVNMYTRMDKGVDVELPLPVTKIEDYLASLDCVGNVLGGWPCKKCGIMAIASDGKRCFIKPDKCPACKEPFRVHKQITESCILELAYQKALKAERGATSTA